MFSINIVFHVNLLLLFDFSSVFFSFNNVVEVVYEAKLCFPNLMVQQTTVTLFSLQSGL